MNAFQASALTTLSISFVGGLTLTAAIFVLASRLPWLARPSANRLNVAPTPVWGGVAIFLSFMTVGIMRGLFNNREAVAAAFGIFLLGFLDDIWRLRPRWKLFIQVLCALAPVSLIFDHPLTGNRGVDFLLAFLWIVGITNAFNLLDNINGLSAGTAVLVSSFQAAFFLSQGEPTRALACIAFAGAILGFLVFNFPKGLVFMGDSGSLFIGFWLAATTLSGTQFAGKSQFSSLVFPLLGMVVPICDTTLVTLTRMFNGRPISVGGTDHLSHRLMAYGFSQVSAVLALWSFSLVSGVLGFFAVLYGLSPFLSAALLLLVAIALFGVYLTRYELRMHFALPEEAVQPPRIAPWVRMCLRVLFDLILIIAAYYTAYLLRFDGDFGRGDIQLFVSTTAELVLIKLCVFVAFGVFRPSWNYFGLKDAYFLVSISALASLIAVTYFSIVYRFYGFSRVVIALDFLVFTFLALISRFSFRLLDELAPSNHRTNVLIYGADSEGETALQIVSKHYRFRVVGFLDDDRPQRNISIHSVPIRGCTQELSSLAKRWDTRVVLLTSSAPADVKHKLAALCDELGIRLLSLQLALVDFTTTRGSGLQEVPQVNEPLVDEMPHPSPKALTKVASSS